MKFLSLLTNTFAIFLLQKNFTEAFPQNIYGNSSFLSDEEKYQIYSNHSISFLAEEYLNWFTDCHFDETRYHNFSQLTNSLRNIDDQYQKYIETIRSTTRPKDVTPNTPGSISVKSTLVSGKVDILLSDPSDISRKMYEIPFDLPVDDMNKNSNIPNKSYVVPMNDTIMTYFKNETLMLNPEIYKRRIMYPKKFDRVFNIILDPDDFIVDESVTDTETLDSMKNLGLLVGGTSDVQSGIKRSYKHRDTSPSDVTYDEYFVTVEPYDYNMEFKA